MPTQNDLNALKVLLAKLDSNRVANLSYTDAAFTGDIVDGVDAFNVTAENNIPTKAHTDLNSTVINKGFRTQAASIPRMTANHFFGRVSYNLNKLIQKFIGFVDSIAAHFAHNMSEYDDSATYAPGDACYVYYPATNGFRTYRRTSVTPEFITGIPVTNAAHWAEAFEMQAKAADFALNASVLAHQYVIDDFDALNPDELTLPLNGDACTFFSDSGATGSPIQENTVGIISRSADDGSCIMLLYSTGGAFLRHYDAQAAAWDGWRKVWDSGNDGTGSGLDADMVDGKHASELSPFPVMSYADFITNYASLTGTFYYITDLGYIVKKTAWGGFIPSGVLTPQRMGRGYALGGSGSPNTANAYGIQFDTEGAISVASALSTARYAMVGVNSVIRGYAMGGRTSGPLTEIDGIQFDTEAAINPAAVLSATRDTAAGVNSMVRGYAMGGSIGPGYTATIEGFQLDTEAVVSVASVLSVVRVAVAGVNSVTRGYAMGGYTSGAAATAEIDGIQFSTEAAINPTAVLSVARVPAAGVNSATRGYAMGGGANTMSTGTEIDGMQFDTEAAINPSAVLSTARRSATGVNTALRGYAMGGYTTAWAADINGIRFDTEATVNPSASLGMAVSQGAGVQSGWL